MKHLSKILLGIGLTVAPIGFDRWSGMYDSVISQIHPNLPDILIIILIVSGMLAGINEYIHRSKFSSNEERKQHSKDLIPIYENLSRLVMHRQDKKLIKMLRIEQKFDNNDDTLLLKSVWEELQNPEINLRFIDTNSIHYLWALDHLKDKEYKEINEYWEQIAKLESKFEKENMILENTIRDIITEKLKEYFPDFKEFEGDEKPSYFTNNILQHVLYALRYEYDGNESNFKFDLVTFGEYRIMFSGSTLMQSSNKDDLKKEDLKNMMLLIFYNEKVRTQFNIVTNIENNSIETLNKFTNKIEHLAKKMKGGYVIKGTCEVER